MPKGISLHIGVNQYQPRYAGAENLESCLNDARAMHDFARKLGYERLSDRPNLLLDSAANVPAVLDYIEAASKILNRGDAFFISFSGHGSQLKDTPEDLNALVERDGMDEVFCMHDGPLVDDVAYGYLAKFELGVRVFAMIDSCNSGSRAELFRMKRKMLPSDPGEEETAPQPEAATAADTANGGRRKRLKREVVEKMLDDPDNVPTDFLAELRLKFNDSNRAQLNALVAVFTACQSDQTTLDGGKNGLSPYTRKFLHSWTGTQSCFELDRALKKADPLENVVPDFKYFKPRELHSIRFLSHVPFVISPSPL